jgi:hypothetical protein
MLRKLSEAACRGAIERGEFGADIVDAAPAVAVVLTQSWCPQWAVMRTYLEALPEDPGALVFYVEYDRETYFEELLAFKEDRLGEREIPYVRYYRNGVFARRSNYMDKKGFQQFLFSDAI